MRELPEDYVEVVGLRLSFYKRFAQADDEDDVVDLACELDPAKFMQKVPAPKSPWKLTPDMRLTRRFPPELSGEALDRVEQLLREVQELKRTEPPAHQPR